MRSATRPAKILSRFCIDGFGVADVRGNEGEDSRDVGAKTILPEVLRQTSRECFSPSGSVATTIERSVENECFYRIE